MRPRRTDANHADVMRALKAVGCSVLDLSAVGGGAPDLLVGVMCRGYVQESLHVPSGVNLLMEIKDGEKEPARRKLKPIQEKWHADWRGQVCIVESVDEALAIVAAIRAESMDGWEP